MRPRRCSTIRLTATLFALAMMGGALGQSHAQTNDWLEFRGPGGLGISASKDVPLRWSAAQNLVWKTEMPGPGRVFCFEVIGS